jgi:putative hydrolase of the HAD superfamily
VPLAALIFDFDGLILDTETAEVEAWRPEFEAHGTPFPEEYFLWAVGRGAEQITKRTIDLLQEAVPELSNLAEIERRANRRRIDIIDSRSARPGIVELIAEAHGVVPLAVASSSRHGWVDTHLGRLGLWNYFETIVCADDVARAKPFPDLYLEAISRLGVPASASFALEDSANGITAAIDAGLNVIAFPNDLTKHLDLSHATHEWAGDRAPSLAEIQALLESAGQ